MTKFVQVSPSRYINSEVIAEVDITGPLVLIITKRGEKINIHPHSLSKAALQLLLGANHD